MMYNVRDMVHLMFRGQVSKDVFRSMDAGTEFTCVLINNTHL